MDDIEETMVSLVRRDQQAWDAIYEHAVGLLDRGGVDWNRSYHACNAELVMRVGYLIREHIYSRFPFPGRFAGEVLTALLDDVAWTTVANTLLYHIYQRHNREA